MDDIMVDYSSVMDREDKKKRFSEELEDKELKESLKLQKLYRQIQRQVHCTADLDEQAWSSKMEAELSCLLLLKNKELRLDRMTMQSWTKEQQQDRGEQTPDIIVTQTFEDSLTMREVKSKEERKKEKKKQKRSSLVVTSGALTFILLAATMVTTSFLMSPMIEQIFVVQTIETSLPGMTKGERLGEVKELFNNTFT